MAVQSLERAFGILRALSLGPSGVTEISDRVGLPKSTVSRLVSSLESEKAVRQRGDGTYELGPGIAQLAEALRDGQSIIDIARPHLTELMELTGEAVGIDRIEGNVIRTLYQIDDPNSSVVVRDWTGVPTPAHVVSAGLAILASNSRATRKNFLSNPLESFTENTMTDPTALEERFTQIRADGFAWVFQEFTDDINSVAASVVDPNGRTTHAIHIHGPSFRFPGEIDIEELGDRLVATAERIEAQLHND